MANEWTVETLKEHFEKILTEKDKAINIALAAAKEAVTVAEKNAEKWRDNANEWRGAMMDREKNFATKAEVMSLKENVEKSLKIEKERADINQGQGVGLHTGWVLLVGVVALISTVIAIISRFI